LQLKETPHDRETEQRLLSALTEHNIGVSRIVAPGRDVSCVLLGQQKAWCGFSTLHVSRTRRSASLDPETEAYSYPSASNATNKSYFQRSKTWAPLLFTASGSQRRAESCLPAPAPLETCTRRFTWLLLFSIPRAILHGPKAQVVTWWLANICIQRALERKKERKKRLALTMCSQCRFFIPARNRIKFWKYIGHALLLQVVLFDPFCSGLIGSVRQASIISSRLLLLFSVLIKLLDLPSVRFLDIQMARMDHGEILTIAVSSKLPHVAFMCHPSNLHLQLQRRLWQSDTMLTSRQRIPQRLLTSQNCTTTRA
jgi:hypothetical protein